MIPTKKDIAFVEYMDEGSATVAKDALHNYRLDGESKIKVSGTFHILESILKSSFFADYFRKKMMCHILSYFRALCFCTLYVFYVLYILSIENIMVINLI